MTEVLVAGEAIVDLHPANSTAEQPGDYERRLGGAPANVAVGLARLGVSPALWSRLGTGPFGSFLHRRLSNAGVCDEWLVRDETAPTGCAVVSVDGDGDRSFTLYLEGTASTRLQPARVDRLPVGDLDWLHVGGVELAHEPARSAVLRLLAAADDTVTVSFDPNYRASLWERFDYRATLDRVVSAVDVLVAAPDDLTPAGYTGSPRRILDQLPAAGPHTVCLTRGPDGAVARATAEAPWGPADATHTGFSVPVENTTGAGDAFTAGAVAELSGLAPELSSTAPEPPDGASGSSEGASSSSDVDSRSLERAVRVGNAAGARCVTARGATTALTGWESITRLLDG